MLALSLEKLERIVPDNVDVQIYLDTCGEERLDEVEYVRDTYLPEASIFRSGSHPYAPSGCWNILNALKQGYQTGARFVFLVEEDVMVRPDFFDWHFNIHEYCARLYFASCGRRRPEYPSDHYTNPGACFPREKLSLVVPHICDEFFADRTGYMNDRFGEMNEASDLDDGLIRRVIRSVHGVIRYPEKPVVAHQGFSSYNRFAEYRTEGTIEERIRQLRLMLPTLKSTNRYTRDFESWGID